MHHQYLCEFYDKEKLTKKKKKKSCPRLTRPWRQSRRVLWTLSNIYDGSFCQKIVNSLDQKSSIGKSLFKDNYLSKLFLRSVVSMHLKVS